jgi:hypothetical protein
LRRARRSLVPDLEVEAGTQRVPEQALDGAAGEHVRIGGDHEPTGAGGGREGRAVLSPHALDQPIARVAGVDLDEIRRRLVDTDFDVGKGSGVQGDLLPDVNGLRRRALVEMVEQQVVTEDPLEEESELA